MIRSVSRVSGTWGRKRLGRLSGSAPSSPTVGTFSAAYTVTTVSRTIATRGAGTAEVTRDGEVATVRENESIYLPLGCIHRLENPGRIPVEIVEVQTGAYLEEDDIVRFEDDFGRS